MNGISVYKARLKMGDYLAETIKETIKSGDVDVVMPILILLDLLLCCKKLIEYKRRLLKIDMLVEL